MPDTKKEIIAYETGGGGPVATALVSLSRLGINCSYFGITGDDEEGGKIRKSLEDENIDVRGLVTRRNADSQVAFIAVEKKSGRRTIFWKRPSGEQLTPDEPGDDFLAGADFLLLDGLMAGVSVHASRLAVEKGVPVMLDAGRIREGTIELAHLCDYVVASEEFAREFVDEGPFSAEKAIMSMNSFGSKASTITLGDKGSITVSGGKVFSMPAFNVDVVDTTGAGDVFHGGYIYGLLKGWDIQRVVQFASAFAALKCRKPGGRAGIPTLKETEDFLDNYAVDN